MVGGGARGGGPGAPSMPRSKARRVRQPAGRPAVRPSIVFLIAELRWRRQNRACALLFGAQARWRAHIAIGVKLRMCFNLRGDHVAPRQRGPVRRTLRGSRARASFPRWGPPGSAWGASGTRGSAWGAPGSAPRRAGSAWGARGSVFLGFPRFLGDLASSLALGLGFRVLLSCYAGSLWRSQPEAWRVGGRA